MKSEEIIQQMQTKLPQLTELFTRTIGVFSVTRSGTVLTVNCSEEHLLKVDHIVSLVGAKTPITVTSIDRTATLLVIVLATNHDLTEFPDGTVQQVTVSGATEAEFNDTFTITNIPNRKTLHATVADSGPTSATGAPVLIGAESILRDYNVPYAVQEILSATSFKVNHPTSGLANPLGTIQARAIPRISGAVDIDRVVEAYTEKEINEYWVYVVLEDVTASRDLKSQSDAHVNRNRATHFREQLLQPFSLYVFIPASEDLSARGLRDIAEELFKLLCKSVLYSRFDSGLTDVDQGAVNFLEHGSQSYNRAVYVHRYSFLQVVDLTFGDTVGASPDVAFRIIDFTMTPSTGEDSVNTLIDLDETPL